MPRTFVSALLILLQTQPVKTGIDVLARDGFAPLQGKRVGLVTNHTGRGAAGTSTIDLLASAKGVTLAALFSPEHKIGCRLEVVKMEGWKRPMYFDETGLPWVNPSPNMRSLAAAISYPGLGALEATSLSVGRGTGRAFVLYGAPWIDG